KEGDICAKALLSSAQIAILGIEAHKSAPSMRRFRNLIFYIAVIGGFILLMYWITVVGAGLENGRNVVDMTSGASPWHEFMESLAHNLHHPLAVLLAQIIAIILVARLF